jgi:hypothetical protein
MNLFGQHLDRHDDRGREFQRQVQRAEHSGVVWMDVRGVPEERLLKFDLWVRRELEERLDWTWAGEHKARRIEQCRVCLERIVLDLWKRGWMLDGKALAGHLQKALDAVAAQQRKGSIQDFWAYFKASVDRYVGSNAEELREEAMRAGSHMSQALAFIGARNGPTLPELAAQRAGEVAQVSQSTGIRRKLALARKKKTAGSQPELF